MGAFLNKRLQEENMGPIDNEDASRNKEAQVEGGARVETQRGCVEAMIMMMWPLIEMMVVRHKSLKD
ncbi:hypothetical protein AMTR_s00029p00219750 [Amborella trichopoda]|uniref:Uncharacterized protein n=1 Tax=Amborella trichopoda TaxID=13333 RepID=W1PNS6_AMBTC|nr:hypothetical protein AMTR_s00029p00219750 [Amborella trichopoda]